MTKKKNPRTRATTLDFDALHADLAAAYAAELERHRTAGTCPPPQLLAGLRAFLADNGVNVPAHAARLDRLKGAFPPDMDAYEKGLSANVVPITAAKDSP